MLHFIISAIDFSAFCPAHQHLRDRTILAAQPHTTIFMLINSDKPRNRPLNIRFSNCVKISSLS
jgi:hypothetical protein